MNSVADEAVVEGFDRSLCRSRVYALIASGLGFPDRDSYHRFFDGSFVAELQLALDVCAPDLAEEFREHIAPRLQLTCSYEEFEALFLSSFETNMPTPSAALNEGVHAYQSNRPALLLELKGFYRNFGLKMETAANELEDTLTAELEFMHFLAAKQSQAETEGLSAAAYQLAQRDFLERHLAAWAPSMRADVAAKVTTPFFVALAELTERFVTAHLEQVRQEIGS